MKNRPTITSAERPVLSQRIASKACLKRLRDAFRTPYFLLTKSIVFVLQICAQDLIDCRSGTGVFEFALFF
jgi:hypothetical protein